MEHPTLDNSRLGWLACAWFEKFGPKSLDRLQKYFGEHRGKEALESDLAALIKAGISENSAKDFVEWRETINPQDLADKLAQDGIDFVLPWDLLYPQAFRQSSTPPAALFWRGGTISRRPWVAVVGTRKMSAYGKRACAQIVTELAQANAGIVSGLALGIDACAHQAALDANVQTVAVLGGGLDKKSLSPSSNVPLAERILLSGGVLMSEYPPGTPSLRQHFPQRNRLIATLAQAVVVVEAGADSGSVLTAKLALDENRDVFAVPGPITSPGSVGTHELLRQGAQICTSGRDVLANASVPVMSAPERPATDEERRILDLCRTPIHVDELTRLLNSSPAVIGATCTTLEMMDALEETEPQIYQITNRGKQLLIQPFSQKS
ncbi:MAG: DNA-processing protein DprA [Patescibacteria group bacterium]|nr:DNA-processing protein DprA [Patescibacteria group bacterium]